MATDQHHPATAGPTSIAAAAAPTGAATAGRQPPRRPRNRARRTEARRRSDRPGHQGAHRAAPRHRSVGAADPGAGRAAARGHPRPATVKPALLDQLRKSAGAPADIAPRRAARRLHVRGPHDLRHAQRAAALSAQAARAGAQAVLQPQPDRARAERAGALNREAAKREAERERTQAEWNALHYTVLQRLVTEVSRVSLEMQSLSLRVESLATRADFAERRIRGLENTGATARRQLRSLELRRHAVLAGTAPSGGGAIAAGCGHRRGMRARRRRRRRRGRRGAAVRRAAPAAAIAGAAADARRRRSTTTPTTASGPTPTAPTTTTAWSADARMSTAAPDAPPEPPQPASATARHQRAPGARGARGDAGRATPDRREPPEGVKLAVVVQRYAADIGGGSELHARYIAEHLAAHADVRVLTTCARDYVTWRNEYPAGETRVHGIPVERFPVARERDTARLRAALVVRVRARSIRCTTSCRGSTRRGR